MTGHRLLRLVVRALVSALVAVAIVLLYLTVFTRGAIWS
jgi:hypothetical protein